MKISKIIVIFPVTAGQLSPIVFASVQVSQGFGIFIHIFFRFTPFILQGNVL